MDNQVATADAIASAREGMWFIGPIALVFAYFYSAHLDVFTLTGRAELGTFMTVAITLFFSGLTTSGRKAWASFVTAALLVLMAVYVFHLEETQATISSVANDRRCEAIQRDMLSARPQRADSPDLFQALGCRPQGEGSVYARPPVQSRLQS